MSRTANNALLQLTGIGHAFMTDTVLSGIDLSVDRGETVCLVGPSGCGKTTLLRIAAGRLSPSEGRMTACPQRVGMVYQEPRLLPWRRVLPNIALGLRARGVSRDQRESVARALAGELGLEAHLDCYPHELSGGLRQRVSLARALAVETDLLLLDEPFSALDVGTRREAQDLLRATLGRRRLGVLMVTHDLTEAIRMADRIVVLSTRPGRIVHETKIRRPFAARDDSYLHRTAAELLAEPAVRTHFFATEQEVA